MPRGSELDGHEGMCLRNVHCKAVSLETMSPEGLSALQEKLEAGSMVCEPLAGSARCAAIDYLAGLGLEQVVVRTSQNELIAEGM